MCFFKSLCLDYKIKELQIDIRFVLYLNSLISHQMKAIITFIFFVNFILSPFLSHSQEISEKAKLSVITCGPGGELYSSFGHSAIRLKDPTNKIDVVFNYGTFDYQTPGFYMKFIRGKLPYALSKQRFSRFYRSYQMEDRWIKEQELNLSDKERQKLVQFLSNNAKPENRLYFYDFFKDNCATKIADVLNENLEILPQYNFDFFEEKWTYRDLLHQYLGDKAWAKFGIDLALGSLIDRKLRPKDYQFLPDYLMASLNGMRENEKVISSDAKDLWKSRLKPKQTYSMSNPIIVFWGLLFLAIVLTINDFRKEKIHLLFDRILFLLAGLTGCVLLFLWFGTDHYATKTNLNILVLSPIFLLLLSNKRKYRLLSIYLLSTLVIAVFSDIFDVQKLPDGFFLLIATLSLRIAYRYYFLSKLDRAKS